MRRTTFRPHSAPSHHRRSGQPLLHTVGVGLAPADKKTGRRPELRPPSSSNARPSCNSHAHNNTTKGSLATRRRRDIVNNYMQTHVDHVMHNMITHLLLTQPSDVKAAMLDYVRHLNDMPSSPLPKQSTAAGRKVSRKDRLYMVSDISPILTELLTDLVRARPKSPLDFMIAWLSNHHQHRDDDTAKVKHKLHSALEYDAQVQHQLAQQAQPVSPGITPQPDMTPDVKRKLLLLGHTGAGKTALIKALCGDPEPSCRPTSGFRKYELGSDKGGTVAFFDLGGKEKAYRSWRAYSHDVHAILFVVDASTDLSVARRAFDYVCRPAHQDDDDDEQRRWMLKGKPVLVVANKQDIPGSASPDEVATALDLKGYQHDCEHAPDCLGKVAVCPCIGAPQYNGHKVDSRLERALDWLIDCIDDHADHLRRRLERERLHVERLEAKRTQQKERRVFRKVLRKAFADPPEECFADEHEGLEFLRSELGVDELPQEAVALAKQVNYQKLALQLLGNFRCPVNTTKRTPMEWSEIAAYVAQRKSEAWEPAMIQLDAEQDMGVMKHRTSAAAPTRPVGGEGPAN